MSVRILTVEDDERIRTAVSLALQEEGWELKKPPMEKMLWPHSPDSPVMLY